MIITIANTKGGVGKTTLVANLAGYLADLGHPVLAVDADIQPALSSYYPIRANTHGLRHLITEADTEDVISPTGIQHLDVIYSDDHKGTLQNFILHTPDGRHRLHRTLSSLRNRYDFIVVDTQGAVGPLQETALFAADLVLTPVRPDKMSATEYGRGTLRVIDQVRSLGRHMGLTVGPTAALLYRVARTRDARNFSEQLQQLVQRREVRLLRCRVPDTAAYASAATHNLPVHRTDRTTRGKTPCGQDIMNQLVKELFPDRPAVCPSDASNRKTA